MLSPFFDFNDRFRLLDSLERFAAQSRDDGDFSMRLRDSGEALELTADLPGVRSEDVEITVEGDILTLRAEAKPRDLSGFKPVRSERTRTRVLRQIELPVRVDAASVAATLKDGVLALTLPKAPEARPRKIPVIAGGAN
jgi:HSP20 family protein